MKALKKPVMLEERYHEVTSLLPNLSGVRTDSLKTNSHVKTVVFTYTVETAINYVFASGSGYHVVLPAASKSLGRIINVKAINAGFSSVIISTAGGVIDEAATQELYNMESMTFQSDGTKWWII